MDKHIEAYGGEATCSHLSFHVVPWAVNLGKAGRVCTCASMQPEKQGIPTFKHWASAMHKPGTEHRDKVRGELPDV